MGFSQKITDAMNNYSRSVTRQQMDEAPTELKYVYIDKNQNPWGTEGTIKIQKYEPGENYFDWHAENTGYDQNEKRILVFTTYLNDVYNGGETEFYYYKEKVKPKEGLTVLFPPFWTHAHRGAMTKEIKYIITGWYRYVH